jgi:mono/diheme cytochrome c family protein
MSNRSVLAAAFLAAVLTDPSRAAPKVITLPADGAQLTTSGLPGYVIARARCVACHSAEYMLYQPASAPRAYWDATVKRMKAVFFAPIDDADMPAIVDYLAKTYGNEQTTSSSSTQDARD